jgi:hypothetical protein
MSKALIALLFPFMHKFQFGDGDVSEPVASAEPTAEDVPATETPSGEPEKTAEKTLTQAEVDEIVQSRLAKERRKLEREIRLETENEYLKKNAQKEEPAATPEVKPVPENYGTYEEYLEALTKHTVAEERKKAIAETQADNEKKATQEKVTTYNERANKAREAHPDFDTVVDQDLPVSKAMMESIIDSELGAEIAYHLGKNPAEAHRISLLSPLAAAREIGKLEAKLTPAEKPTIEEPSKAPKPATPVKGTSTPSNVPSDNDSITDWLAKRNKQLKRA